MKISDILVRMSLSGAVMILMIAVIRAVFIHKLPKKSFVLMWEIAVARLLVPIEVPAVTSVYTLIKLIAGYFGGSGQEPPLPAAVQPVADSILVMTDPQAVVISNINIEVSPASEAGLPAWRIVRLSGAVILAAAFAALYFIAYRKHRFAERVECDMPAEFGLKRNVEVRVLSGISSPLTYGLIKPVILLPKSLDLNDSERLRMILLHEITHIRRFDVLRKLAAVIALCVHWWDPLVWVLFVLYNRDIELVCDDAVIGKLGHENRRAYAAALVDLLDKNAGIVHNYFSRNAVEERVSSIMKHKKTRVVSVAAATVLVVMSAACFATSAAEITLVPTHKVNAWQRSYFGKKYELSTLAKYEYEAADADGAAYTVRTTDEYREFANDLIRMNILSESDLRDIDTDIPHRIAPMVIRLGDMGDVMPNGDEPFGEYISAQLKVTENAARYMLEEGYMQNEVYSSQEYKDEVDEFVKNKRECVELLLDLIG